MNRRPRLSVRPRAGMTLVEILVATGIIALAAAMLLMAVGSAMNVMRRGRERQLAGDSAYAQVEQPDEADAQPAVAGFSVGGRHYTVPGTALEARDAETGVIFHAFIPD